MATFDATKAKVAALVAGLAGFVAPGAAYLLTVDGDGVSGTEWLHATFIAVLAAAAQAGAVGYAVYRAENKPKAE